MLEYCPHCETEREVEYNDGPMEIEVRGEKIVINTTRIICTSCGQVFFALDGGEDPFEKAYREYRHHHGLLQPEEIKSIRKKYGLTQQELSRLLGWGDVTLSRYENGSLQDEAHDKEYRLIQDPANLQQLIDMTPNAFTPSRMVKVLNSLKELGKATQSSMAILIQELSNYKSSIYSGFKQLDIIKLINAILYYCQNGLYKTSLNKLLFYMDFKHYREETISITGLQYARLPYGPCPNEYSVLYSIMLKEEYLFTEETYCADDGSPREIIKSRILFDVSVFNTLELETMIIVQNLLKDKTAAELSDFSHKEKAWKETNNGELISYEYAKQLQL